MDDAGCKNRLSRLVNQSESYQKQLIKELEELQRSIGYFRIVVKYLLFDVEATRRENDYLRKLLEDNS